MMRPKKNGCPTQNTKVGPVQAIAWKKGLSKPHYNPKDSRTVQPNSDLTDSALIAMPPD